MSRHARAYCKQLFEDLPISSIDEFSLLDAANFLNRPTKTQLFQYDLMEVSTGTQMLARLLKQGLVKEEPNPDDRRLKHIVLTKQGQSLLVKARARMIQLGDLLFQPLPDNDLKRLEAVLLRLNYHHTTIRSGTR